MVSSHTSKNKHHHLATQTLLCADLAQPPTWAWVQPTSAVILLAGSKPQPTGKFTFRPGGRSKPLSLDLTCFLQPPREETNYPASDLGSNEVSYSMSQPSGSRTHSIKANQLDKRQPEKNTGGKKRKKNWRRTKLRHIKGKRPALILAIGTQKLLVQV